jgi:hypothetical protein
LNANWTVYFLFIFYLSSSFFDLLVLSMTAYLSVAFQGAMSFSLTGKIASSRGKISGKNNGTAHGAPQFSALLSYAVYGNVRRVTHKYSKLVPGLSVVSETDQKILICTSYTFLRLQNNSPWRERHGPKSNSKLPPTSRAWQFIIVFVCR